MSSVEAVVIACPHCIAPIPTEGVQGELARATCPRCGEVVAFSGEVAPSARGMASEHLWLAPTSEIHGLTLRRSAHALRVLDDGLPGWLGQGLELNASGLVRVGWRSSSVRLALSEVVVFAPIQRFPAYVEPRSRETFFVVRNVVSAVRAGTSELEFVADTLCWPEALALSQLMNGLLHQLRTTSPYR